MQDQKKFRKVANGECPSIKIIRSPDPLPTRKRDRSAQLYFRAADGEPDFSDRLITSGGQGRTIAGDFAEEATAAVSDSLRLKTDSRCPVCPDLQWLPDVASVPTGTGAKVAHQGKWNNPLGHDNIFFETKSVGCSGSAIVYRCRIAKDRYFIHQDRVPPGYPPRQLYYWFWFHAARVEGAPTVQTLQYKIAKSIAMVYVVNVTLLADVLEAMPVKQLNTGYIKTGPNSGQRLGYGKYDYGDGWSVSYKLLDKLCPLRVPVTLRGKPYGYRLGNPRHRYRVQFRVPDFSYTRFLNQIVRRPVISNPPEVT